MVQKQVSAVKVANNISAVPSIATWALMLLALQPIQSVVTQQLPTPPALLHMNLALSADQKTLTVTVQRAGDCIWPTCPPGLTYDPRGFCA